jgi:hypothetical protein
VNKVHKRLDTLTPFSRQKTGEERIKNKHASPLPSAFFGQIFGYFGIALGSLDMNRRS